MAVVKYLCAHADVNPRLKWHAACLYLYWPRYAATAHRDRVRRLDEINVVLNAELTNDCASELGENHQELLLCLMLCEAVNE